MKTKAENIKKITIDNLIEYGEYANSTRGTISSVDGLKTVHRRIIYASSKICKNKLVKTAELIGNIISNLHPHGDLPIFSSITTMVQNGVLIGKGNWGSKLSLGKSSPAAYRYTSVKLSPIIEKLGIIDLLDTSVYSINDLEKEEPVYLPTPVPITMISFNDYPSPMLGIGLVVRSKYPIFDLKSLLENIPSLSDKYYKYIKEKTKITNKRNTKTNKKLIKSEEELINQITNINLKGYKGTVLNYNIKDVMLNNKFNIVYKIDISHNGTDEIYINSPINNIRNIDSLADLQELIENKIFSKLIDKYNIDGRIINFSVIEEERKDSYRIIIKFKLKNILKIPNKLKNKYGISNDILKEIIKELSDNLSYSESFDIKTTHYKIFIESKMILNTNELLTISTYDDLINIANKIIKLKNTDPSLITVRPFISNKNTLEILIETYNMFKISNYIKIINIINKLEAKIFEMNLLNAIKNILINYNKKIKNNKEYNLFINHVLNEINDKKITKEIINSLLTKYSISVLLKSEYESTPFINELNKYKRIINNERNFNKYINNHINNSINTIFN